MLSTGISSSMHLLAHFVLFFEVWLIYGLVLVSGIEHTDSVLLSDLYSMIGCYKVLGAIPSAVQYCLVVCLFCM